MEKEDKKIRDIAGNIKVKKSEYTPEVEDQTQKRYMDANLPFDEKNAGPKKNTLINKK